MTPEEALPDWATPGPKPGVIVVDIDQAYPALLAEYRALADELNPEPDVGAEEPHIAELRKLDPAKPDQYWLEVVYQSAKFDVHRAFVLAGVKAWAPNLTEIRIRGDKRQWAQKLYPEGCNDRSLPAGITGVSKGVWFATKGKEARRLYTMMRGFLPN